MQIVFGVEHKELRDRLPGFVSQFIRNIATTARVVDRDDRLLIVQSRQEYEKLIHLFKEENVLESSFELYPLQSPTSTFNTDYGFVSTSNHAYLYKDTSAPYQVEAGNEENSQMALLQMEEHLIGLDDSNDPPVYYVDRKQKELIERIAHAYHISVTFL